MAAPITTTSTTLEGQLVEVIQAIESAERVYNAANPAATKNQVSLSVDPEGATIAGSFSLGCTVSGTGGTLNFATVAYL
jgi:uncharacterized protein YqgV (UPF0045/DUF77 family)